MVGNLKLMLDKGISIEEIEAEVSRLEAEGKTAMLVAVDGTLAGVVTGLPIQLNRNPGVPLRQ